MRIVILYHYFHPDDVISARLFSELAEHLAAGGHEVDTWPCRRGCRDEGEVYAASESWNGVSIRRIWRPAFSQKSSVGRVLNAVWMICAWKLRLRPGSGTRPDLVIVGSDPPCAVAAASHLRKQVQGPRVICWLHDVYPEIAAAAGMLAPEGRPYRWLSKSVSAAYTGCAAVVDIGPAMKSRVAAGSETITPWALYEPESPPAPDPAVRKELFGDAKLGLLYSGNFGRAHDAVPFLKLAERLKRDGVAVAFAVRGNCVEGLKAEMAKFDANARLVRFEEDPSQHFAAADIHLVSLKEEWAGLVVPSKYFGSLAFGKPVLYAGPDGSDIAIWTNKFETGWVLKEDNFADVAEEIRRIAGKKNELHVMGGKCFGVYQEHFSKEKMLAKWDDLVAECGRN